MKITAIRRPFALVARNGNRFLLTSVEAQRLIDGMADAIVDANACRVTFADGNCLAAATPDGLDAFLIDRAATARPSKFTQDVTDVRVIR
jgi:hypothetical protein